MQFRRFAGLLAALSLALSPTLASAQFTQAELEGARAAAEEAQRRNERLFPLLLVGGAVIIAVIVFLIVKSEEDEDDRVSP